LLFPSRSAFQNCRYL